MRKVEWTTGGRKKDQERKKERKQIREKEKNWKKER